MLLSAVQNLADSIHEKTVSFRRYLHQNPELSFEEYQTAEFIAKVLTEFNIPFESKVAKTGIVATIQGKPGTKTIALRADIDALPIQEENTCVYASQVNGKMHACGHDAHTASLLGTAFILNELKNHWSGTIKLIFQPSEEKLPGGASVMIQEGMLQKHKIQSIVGQHVMPLLPVGKIGIRSGIYMASTDEIYLTVCGKGGHGAQPHTTIDPVAITAQIIVSAQQLVSRMADPRTPCVLTFGKIIANGATNIIPDSVYLEGTFRAFDENWRAAAHQKLQKLILGIAESFGAIAKLEIRKGYPVLVNEPELTKRVESAIEQYVGRENVVPLELWTAAEDFAYYTQEIPGCFYRLGTRNESKGIIHGLH
ncbi:MAG: M20 family metallopeptidase, partial [Bacteroidia bacterium]|nr:M20 family metallopeptidase [Bacteroidia bacterium]